MTSILIGCIPFLQRMHGWHSCPWWMLEHTVQSCDGGGPGSGTHIVLMTVLFIYYKQANIYPCFTITTTLGTDV